MTRHKNEWFDHLVDSWTGRGWITADAADKIRKSYGRDARRNSLWSPLPFYGFLGLLGLVILILVLLWAGSLFWYQVSLPVRLGLAAVLLLCTQIGVGLTMAKERQGTLLAEGVALIHGLGIFTAMALMEQTFYIGWDLTDYLLACAVLFLPAAYFLRSLATLFVYDFCLIYWSAAGGPATTFGGMALLWLLLALTVPLYHVFVSGHEEKRLSGYSWAMTVTAFASFGLASYAMGQMPFLILASLAVTLLLVGYSLDLQKAWGLPFRWCGRIAAAVALLLSCLPAVWANMAEVTPGRGSLLVIVLLFIAMLFMLVKTVNRWQGTPLVYFLIPCLLAFETFLVRSSLYSSLPLIMSALYLIFVGFYEASLGFQPGKRIHLQYSLCLFVALVVAFFFGTDFSPVVPLLLIAFFALVLFQFKRTESNREEAAQRAQRRIRLRHQATKLHEQAPAVNTVRDSKENAAMMAEWLDDLHLPDPEDIKGETMPEVKAQTPAPQFTGPDIKNAAEAAPLAFSLKVPEKNLPQQMQVSPPPKLQNEIKPVGAGKVTAPVAEMKKDTSQPEAKEIPMTPPKSKRAESPWSQLPQAPKRQKKFTHSPWSQEGGKK